MPEPRRIVFSTDTPNDQGGIIKAGVIDFEERFNANPVLLCQHNWEGLPLGKMTDIKLESGKWTGLPVFHEETEDAKTYKSLYDKGFLNACSIGGEAIWKKNARGDYEEDADGFRICEKFILYEISMVTLPSNPDAVAALAAESKLETKEKMQARFYGEEKNRVVTKLSVNAPQPKEDNTAKVTAAMQAIKTIPTKQILTTTLNKTKMADTLEVTELTAEEKEAVVASRKKAAEEKAKLAAEAKEGEGLPGWFKKLIGLNTKVTFEPAGHTAATTTQAAPVAPVTLAAPIADNAPAPKDTPIEAPGKKTSEGPQAAGPIGLSAKDKAKKKLEDMKEKAAQAQDKAMEAKEKAEKEDAKPEHKEAFEKAKDMAEECMKAVEAAKKEYEESDDDDEDGDGETMSAEEKAEKEKEKKAANKGTKTALSATPEGKKYRLLTVEELAARQVNIQPMITRNASVYGDNSKIPKFSTLYSTNSRNGLVLKEELEKWTAGSEPGSISYDAIENKRIMLASILKDPKFATIVNAARFDYRSDIQRGQTSSTRNGQRIGLAAKDIMGRMSSGNFEFLDKGNQLRRGSEMTKLTATDTFLASPDVYAIDFLALAIFQLFPSNSWKKDIPMFGAADAENNTGLVWTNITAAPAIAIGSPGTPSNYTYTDTAVSISPVPFFLQPMEWFPYLMHQLRYDQMGTGWAQAFADWAAVMDDYMIWQLASQLPAASFVNSTGISGYQTAARTINVVANGANSFYWNKGYSGTLLGTVINDIITTEQIYMGQNFQLDQPNQKPTLVIDPTAWGSFGQDPQFQSLLTRWIESKDGDFLRYSNTDIVTRSRVAVLNQATNTVVNPYSGSIPAQSVGANLGFIPSQVGIAIAALDVFMRQEPGSYGYLMSADMRMGANWLRANFNGGVLYNYGLPPAGPV